MGNQWKCVYDCGFQDPLIVIILGRSHRFSFSSHSMHNIISMNCNFISWSKIWCSNYAEHTTLGQHNAQAWVHFVMVVLYAKFHAVWLCCFTKFFFRNINIQTMTCGHLNSMCFHIFSLDSSCFFLLVFFLKSSISNEMHSSVAHQWFIGFGWTAFLFSTHTLLLGNFTFLFHLLYFVQLDHMCCFCFYYHVNNCL